MFTVTVQLHHHHRRRRRRRRRHHHHHCHHHHHILLVNTCRQTIGNKTKTGSQKIPRSSELAAYRPSY